jgi:hypothetical protein
MKKRLGGLTFDLPLWIDYKPSLVPASRSHVELVDVAREMTAQHEASDFRAIAVFRDRKVNAEELFGKLSEYDSFLENLSSVYHKWSEAPRKERDFKNWKVLSELVRELDGMREDVSPLLEKFRVMKRNTDFLEEMRLRLAKYAHVQGNELRYHSEGELRGGGPVKDVWAHDLYLSVPDAVLKKLRRELKGRKRAQFVGSAQKLLSEATLKLAAANAHLNGVESELKLLEKTIPSDSEGTPRFGVLEAGKAAPTPEYARSGLKWLQSERQSTRDRIDHLTRVSSQLDEALNVVKFPGRRRTWIVRRRK